MIGCLAASLMFSSTTPAVTTIIVRDVTKYPLGGKITRARTTGEGEKGVRVFQAEETVCARPQDGKEEGRHFGGTKRMLVNYW